MNMKLGIMQPYFFPYLGYYSLIKHTDLFILLDTVQFIRHGWIERNRILKPNVGWQYIKVPLCKYSRETKISDICIRNDFDWKIKILAQLQHYKKKAPHYYSVIDLIDDAFTENFTSITDLNYAILQKTCNYLGLDKPIEVFSRMDIEIERPKAPDEWALNICKKIPHITEYWNPPGGSLFFDRKTFEKNDLLLCIQAVKLSKYDQKRRDFEAGLSIIDVMMFNDGEEIHTMLDNYELS